MKNLFLRTLIMGINFRWNFLDWGNLCPISNLTSTSPNGEIDLGEDNANNADDGWDPWPVEQVQQEQPPAPVPVVNNEEEQFSYQFSGLEDLPSDESVGLFNDIVIPQAVNFPQEEALDHEVVVLALPVLPPADPFLEGNNDQNKQGAQNLNPNADDNLIVVFMTHLNQPSQDPAYNDFLARKCFSSWAELCPPVQTSSPFQNYGLLSLWACL
jgi:hypothetical protein